jgi:polyisoprenoid-binding protein YceI
MTCHANFFISALMMLAASTAIPAQAADWIVDAASSRIGFSGQQVGVPFEGSFQHFSAQISFDPAKPEEARIAVLVDLASAHTGDRQRDTALPGADWFDVAAHPTARFAATGVRRTGPDSFVAAGELTLRGITRPVDLPFTLQINGNSAHAKGNVQIVRTVFGVGQGQWASGQWVALDVGVNIDVVARTAEQF